MTHGIATRPLGAQISHMLKSRGVEVVFGIPGVHNQEMYRGIEEAGLTHILARHEQGAGFMADGYARATGRPGVCYVITGPGVCNIMTPMGQAYSDSVPMLVLASCLDETAARTGQLHQMKDQVAAARTVCDWAEVGLSADAAYLLIDRALAEFSDLRPRPKYVQVPIQTLMDPAPEAPHTAPERGRTPAGREVDVDVAAAHLRQAKRPLIVFGGGARYADCVALMRETGAAAFTTYAGRGVLGADHPMNFGSYLARPGSAEIFAQADLVLAIGTELAEVDLWRHEAGHSCPMIRVDIDAAQLVDPHRAETTLLADAGWFISRLCDALVDHTPHTLWTPKAVAAARARWRAEIEAERPGILPVVDLLREELPHDTIFYSDMTQFAYAAKEVFALDGPGLWFHPSGFGTLGYALPAAIGGKIGAGAQPVVAIAGDYGFQYTLQELAVAVELGLNLPIILWDNGKLGEIEDSMVRAQIAPNAVIQRNPDFCKLAEAYGAASATPQNRAELRAALQAALKADGPTLIHVTPATGAA